MTYFISGHRDLTWGLSDADVEQAIHILNDPSLDRELLLRKLASLRLKNMSI